jgi:hypothetical protein
MHRSPNSSFLSDGARESLLSGGVGENEFPEPNSYFNKYSFTNITVAQNW